MMSDEQKQAIIEEERFRLEIRSELERTQAKSRGSSFLDFLNTPVGVLLLSSSVLGSFGYLYTRHDRLRDEARAKAEVDRDRQKAQAVLAARLDQEIAHRLVRITEAVNRAVKESPISQVPRTSVDGNSIKYDHFNISDILLYWDSDDDDTRSLCDSYRKRSLSSLLLELSEISSDRERPELEAAADAAATWAKRLRSQNTRDIPGSEKLVRELKERGLDAIRIKTGSRGMV